MNRDRRATYWIVAGPDGAGATTFAPRVVAEPLILRALEGR